MSSSDDSHFLRTTSAIGLYEGGQSLLISKHEYLYKAHALKEDSLPVDLWIYFGFSQSDNKTGDIHTVLRRSERGDGSPLS